MSSRCMSGFAHALNLVVPVLLLLLALRHVSHKHSELPQGGRCSAASSPDGVCIVRPTPSPSKSSGQCLVPTSTRLLTTSVTAATFSESNPAHESLFGPIRPGLTATVDELAAGKHPRILTSRSAWEDILHSYSDPVKISTRGTWAYFFHRLSFRLVIASGFVREMAGLETNGTTSVYKGRAYAHDNAEFEAYRQSLLPLVNLFNLTRVGDTDGLVICTLWASVARLQKERMHENPVLGEDAIQLCVNAAVGWAKIALSHRTYHCNPSCPYNSKEGDRADIWNTDRRWALHHDWFTGGTGLAFTYDYLFDDMTDDQRRTIRSAIAMSVLDRHVWGANDVSDASSPNIFEHAHRAFSNWAGYNSNLYLANLAIEGELDFDNYASAVLDLSGSEGFNVELNTRYEAVLEQFMLHSFYPDGSTFEDGYSYFIALREGSLGMLALQRRGFNVLSSPRFRNIIHNAAQMFEPWQCGNLVGHSSGGGNLYNAYVGLFRYVYPQGELPGMIWRLRFGDYENKPCRTSWIQSVMQLAFLGGEHSSDADSPGTIKPALRNHFSLSYYAPRRGLLIARSSLTEHAVYIHFDARPDAFLVGHDNADRGVFTFSALRQTWLDDLAWRDNMDSRKHSLMHIDGLAQDLRAPSVKMLKVLDDGRVVLAAADLTYAYNWQWGSNGHKHPSRQRVTVYNETGHSSAVYLLIDEPEELDPWTLGWPEDDRAADIGFFDDMPLNGIDNIGFAGLYQWKRPYRQAPDRFKEGPIDWIEHMVRSVALIRNKHNEFGTFIVADSILASRKEHLFESYLILEKKISVDVDSSSCEEGAGSCRVILQGTGGAQVELLIHTMSRNPTFRLETFEGGNRRVVVRSKRQNAEEFWMAVHPLVGIDNGLSARKLGESIFQVANDGDVYFFSVANAEHAIEQVEEPQVSNEAEASWTPEDLDEASSPSPSSISHPSGTSSALMSVLPMPYEHPPDAHSLPSPEEENQLEQVMVSPSYSPTPSKFPTVTAANSPSTAPSSSARSWPSESPSISPSLSAVLPSATPSRSGEVSQSPTASHSTIGTESPTPSLSLSSTLLASTSVTISPSVSAMGSIALSFSPTPSASATERSPMIPQKLQFGKSQLFRFSSMTASVEQFYTKSSPGALRQLVFVFMSQSNPQRGLVDTFSTCFKKTNAQAAISIYDCGSTDPARKYANRDCTLISDSVTSEACDDGAQEGVRVKAYLGRWKVYYLVVSVLGGTTRRPRLALLHDTVEDGQPSETDSPVLSGHPPLPWPLRFRKSQVYGATALQSSDGKLFHHSHADHQIVFEAVGAANGEEKDTFGTCYRKTTVRVEMAVYDCGSGSDAQRNYASRTCKAVGHSSSGDRCGKFKTKFHVNLQLGKKYFVVVDVFERSGMPPVLAIFHKVFS